MREIKFRLFGKNSKEFLCDEQGYGLTLQEIQNVEHLEGWEVSQYTGLKDKNGKEIYEGDIITVECAGGLQTFEVIWEEKHARFNRKNCPYMAGGCSHGKGVEIIGNIYENPDLLEESKD